MKKVLFNILIIPMLFACSGGGKVKIDMDDPKLVIAEFYEGKITVDGNLKDWKGAKSYFVSEDMSIRGGGLNKVDKTLMSLNSTFYVRWDEEAIYLACHVVDDVIINHLLPRDQEAFYRGDSIEYYFDLKNVRGENNKKVGKGLYKIAVNPFDRNMDPQACRHEDSYSGPIAKVSPDTEFMSKKVKGGYNIEISIPFEYMLKEPPSNGISMPFNHTIHNTNDKDGLTTRVGHYLRTEMISWIPEPEIWANPQMWAPLLLDGKPEVEE